MAPSTKYKPITSAVALLLKGKEHTGRLYNLKDVANQLQIAAGIEGNDNIPADFDALVANAFVNRGYPDGYPLSYEHYFGFRRDKHALCIVRSRQSSSSGSGARITAIDRFRMMEDAQCAKIVRWNVELEEDVTATMVDFLEEETKKLNVEKEEKETASRKRHSSDDISSEANQSKKQKTHLTEIEVQANASPHDYQGSCREAWHAAAKCSSCKRMPEPADHRPIRTQARCSLPGSYRQADREGRGQVCRFDVRSLETQWHRAFYQAHRLLS